MDDKHALEVDKNDLNRKLGAQEEKVAQLLDQKTKMQQDLESTKSSTLDINSELSQLNNELREKQNAFERYQNEAEAIKFNFERRVDELERQNGLMEQQCDKLKNEVISLQTQKIESENQLNQELQHIKQRSDEEKLELQRELGVLRSCFDSEKIQLSREKSSAQESFDKCRDELEAKISDLQSTIEALELQLEAARKQSKESESSMGTVVDELKKKEAQIAVDLEEQRLLTDELKKTIGNLEASKVLLKSENDEKISLHKEKISKLEDDLKMLEEQKMLVAAGAEEKIKFLDDMRAKSYEMEQKITGLTHQLENETGLKKKAEASLNEINKRFQDMEEEQVDLVHIKEELKFEHGNLQQKIEELKKSHDALEEKLKSERKKAEDVEKAAQEHSSRMDGKVNELTSIINSKELEKVEIIEKIHLREEEIVQLQAAMQIMEGKLRLDSDETYKLLKGKDEELRRVAHEAVTKDNLIADLNSNLENIKTCLETVSIEKETSSKSLHELHETISSRDFTIDQLKERAYSLEKVNKELESQLKNFDVAKNKTASESQLQINDLMEQIVMLEDVKEKEVRQLTSRLEQLQSQMSFTNSEASMTVKSARSSEQSLLVKVKDLELRETELMLLTANLQRKMAELEEMKGVPRTGDAYDTELQNHIEFLNSIIADMHKKNLHLSKQVELLAAGPSLSDESK